MRERLIQHRNDMAPQNCPMLTSNSLPPRFSPKTVARLCSLGLLPIATILFIRTSEWPSIPGFWSQSPHPYPFASTLQSENSQTLERSIAFYQGRIHQNSQDGLDRATLANLYIQMARATDDENWYSLAEQAARQSLTNLPFHNDGAVLALARLAEASHNFAEAIRLAEQVPGPEGMAIVVAARLGLGDISAAAAEAEQLVAQYPSLGSFTLRGLTRFAQGDDEGAMEDWQAAIALEEPAELRGSAQTRVFLGRLYTGQGDYAKARRLYREALRIVPDYPLAYLQLAELETRLGHYQTAERHYRAVADPVALHGLARLKSLRGQPATDAWNEAEAALRQEVAQSSLDHQRDLAHLLLERGHPDDTAEALALMEVEASQRRDAETLDLLAWALAASGRWLEARAVLQEVMERGVRDAGMAHRAADIELALNNPTQAEQFRQLAQDIEPSVDQQTRRRLGLMAQH